MTEQKPRRPPSITILAILLVLFGLFAIAGSLVMWGEGFILAAPEGADIAFPVTDLLVNGPAALITAAGLWKLRRTGYLGAYFVAGFYIYASVYIFVEVIQGGPPYPIEIVAPQALAVLVAIGLMVCPNRFRDLFT
jgi:hypothetical protein